MKPTATIPLLLCLALPLCCQQEKPKDLVAEMLATFTKGGIDLDLKSKTLSIDVEVGHPGQPLEYLLVNPRGKAYEALLLTEVKASLLNAALLALGYQKGENARMVDKDPPPSMEEIEKGAPIADIIPPSGMSAWFTVAYKDEVGRQRELPVEDLIVDLTAEKPVEGAKWIFLGGRMGAPNRGDPPVFLADLAGNLVSICYLDPPNHLMTMSHQRAADDNNWWVDEKNCPKPGTKLCLTIHRNKPALLVEREQRRAKDEKRAGKTP